MRLLNDTPSIVRYDDWSYELGLAPYFDPKSESASPSPKGGDDDDDRGCGFFFFLVAAILVAYYLLVV